MTENDFMMIMDIKHAITEHAITLSKKIDEILSRHTVRDIGWRGQIVPFERQKITLKEENK